MRKLVSHLLLTLDGTAMFSTTVIGAIMKLRDEEVEADFFKHVADEDAMLLGRVTYSEWAGFWPTSTIEPFASHINSVPKYVASKTLSSAPWGTKGDTHLLRGAIEDDVANLKRRSGKNIGVHGSPTLVESLLQANLLDELRLEIYPVIAGAGAPFFRPGRDVKQLELVRSRITANGVAMLTYRPAGASSQSHQGKV
jgi:dihydrofolate reductase